jgi:phosphopantothenoylcysteine decarboxylase/phosphopantothenate--cysteine ligase
MTEAAQRFVTPLTFSSLTGRRVLTSLWSGEAERDADGREGGIEHVAVAQEIDALVVAPATAHVLARFANGIADDFLSTVYLATTAPVIVAPAMNVHMWQHAATQANVRVLEERGVRVVAPGAGYLACGMTGEGRLAEVEQIADAAMQVLRGREELAGETVLITAGGTREAIDPVRYLGNRSSGRMGYALAEAAVRRGARVVLVTASALGAPAGCEVVRVATAEEMASAVFARLDEASVVVMAAAVADYRPREVSAVKLRRAGGLTLELEPTEDIVAEIVERRREGTTVVAFAAEMEDLETSARAKLERKGADAIVANDVSVEGIGFESERNAGLFLTRDRRVELVESSKREMAERVLDEIVALRKG